MRENIPHYKNLGHKVDTVIHVGAHEAEELKYYATVFKSKNILLIEPQPEKYSLIKQRIQEVRAISNSNIFYYPIAVGANTGKAVLTSFSGNSSGWASILKPKVDLLKTQLARNPSEFEIGGGGIDKPVIENTVHMSSLCKLAEKHTVFQRADLLVIDTQGYELEVLKGFTKYLRNIRSIDLEVTRNKDLGFYENTPSELECSSLLDKYHFSPDFSISSFWGKAQHGRLLYRNQKM